MTPTRRRFLTIAASFAAIPAHAAQRWQGRALGAEVEITINGPRDLAQAAFTEAQSLLAEVEQLFSLYDPGSRLSQLNETGTLTQAPSKFIELMDVAARIHRATNGLFDPSIQPLWRAHARGLPLPDAPGWDQLSYSPERIMLAKGQALTFNGIAQGFATDLVAEMLRTHGLSNTLVNIGEFRGHGGPWRLGLSDPIHGQLGTRTLTTGAIATSSPGALDLGDAAHILHRGAKPLWSTVSVEARDATTADAVSTALTLARRDLHEDLIGQMGITQITTVDLKGNLTTLR